MSFGSKHAREKVTFTFDSHDIENYITLKDVKATYGDRPQVIRKLWISDSGKFGPHPMITTSTYHVNLPGWLLPDIQQMMQDAEDVADINAGRAAFRVIEKTKRNSKDTYLSVEWCDPEDLPF